MKKLLLFLAAAGLIGTAYAQTQRTSRTNSRPHDRSEVTKDVPVTDQDKNNPNPTKNADLQKGNAKDSVSRSREK